MKKTALLIFSLFLTFMVLNAQGKERHGNKDSMNCPKYERGMGKKYQGCMPMFFLESDEMKKELGLTEDQVSKIKAANSELQKQTEPIHEKQKNLHQEMRKLDEKYNSTISDYEKIIKEISSNMTEMQILHAKYRIQIKSILTQDQKEKLKAKHDKMRGKENRRKHRDMDTED
ncbi:MAG TPA: Spy/CpxP family protein refolding chaperone [Spirochaetota bacterium]|nr:Spy/CpxP family protein refolding chaperone [Spirochaetota bacterium]